VPQSRLAAPEHIGVCAQELQVTVGLARNLARIFGAAPAPAARLSALNSPQRIANYLPCRP
jgi:hypothetical protein